MPKYIDRELVLRQLDEKYISAIVQQKHDDVTEEHKKLWKGIQSGVNYARNIVSEAPTKDVVPRSEVEQLQKSNDMAYDKLRNLYKEAITEHSNQVAELMVKLEQAKQDVAREIFEEFKKNMVSIDDIDFNRFIAIGRRTFIEIEKKYIGE